MRSTILSIIVIFLITSCTQSENNSKLKKTIITGQVSNFTDVSEYDFIEVIYEDILANQITISENIDKNGQFRFELDIEYPKEFYLKYNSLLAFHISPGDSLHFDINGDCWDIITETSAEEYNFYKVSGTCEKMNSDIINYTALFLDSVNNWDLQSKMIASSTPSEYKTFMTKLTNERNQIVLNFNQEYNTCEEFKEWISLKLKFTEWEDLMRYRWVHPMQNQKDITEYFNSMPDEYFSFLTEWDSENREYLKSKNYISFLNEYAMYYDQKLSEDALSHLDKDAPNSMAESFKIRKAHILKLDPGFTRDILLAKMYYRLLDAKYYNLIKDIYTEGEIYDLILAERIQEKYDYEKELFENPQFAEGSILNELKNESGLLQTLIKKYTNKVIYIDFWAPWCGPCMNEMPHAKKIKKQFGNKEVVFVYLGNQCEETAWKTTIAEKKIEGEHYHLTDKQFSELKEILKIQGIPHYSLIDKNGNIVSENAIRPSSGDELIDLINKYLN